MAVAVTTLYCGQLLFETDDYNASVFLTVLVLVVNICFWAIWIFFNMWKSLTSFALKNPDSFISRLLTRMTVRLLKCLDDKSLPAALAEDATCLNDQSSSSAALAKDVTITVSTTIAQDGPSMSMQSRKETIMTAEKRDTAVLNSPVSFQNQPSKLSRRTLSAIL
mmetsp:Transcript_35981/g.59936  ORF Transcript_35981/g.59936 Transcript_35981/m.59936 type:complete len:165 (-) Transcript_35981:230-724(-)